MTTPSTIEAQLLPGKIKSLISLEVHTKNACKLLQGYTNKRGKRYGIKQFNRSAFYLNQLAQSGDDIAIKKLQTAKAEMTRCKSILLQQKEHLQAQLKRELAFSLTQSISSTPQLVAVVCTTPITLALLTLIKLFDEISSLVISLQQLGLHDKAATRHYLYPLHRQLRKIISFQNILLKNNKDSPDKPSQL